MIAITDIDENRTSNDIDLFTVLVGLVAAIGEAAHDADGDEDEEAEVGGGCHVVCCPPRRSGWTEGQDKGWSGHL